MLSPHLYNIYVCDQSKKLTSLGVGCFAGGRIINHLYYADDLVLLAPSVRALQQLLNVCTEYAEEHQILHNTDKSVIMIMWPRRASYKHLPQFTLSSITLKHVSEYKYLGYIIDIDGTDDKEMLVRMRGLYAAGNMLSRNFSKCSGVTKSRLFQAYCTNVYSCCLWNKFKVGSWKRV